MWQPLLLALLIITAINISAFFWAYFKQTDHLTDISYSLSFVGLVVVFFILYGEFSTERILMLAMITFWGVRLGTYLFYRINKIGRDERFDKFRSNWVRFLRFWILQSISIWIIALPVMVFLAKSSPKIWIGGFVIWVIGFILETIADYQKFQFKTQHKNEYMMSGLFRYVRYPNYLGEILCWLGVFLYAFPSFQGMEWLTVFGLIWIVLLLLFISGIPLLEKQAEEKYGSIASFRAYKNKTFKLIPFIY